MGLTVDPFGLAIGMEDVQGRLLAAVQDGIDGEFASDVLHLTAAEVVSRCEIGALGRSEGGEHRVPDLLPDGRVRALETDFVEEAALEGRVEILGQVGRGNQDPIQ